MSFEKMQDIKQIPHERTCILLYGLMPPEIKQVESIARLIGLKDVVVVSPEYCGSLVKDLLDNKLLEKTEVPIREKAIIFNNTSSARVSTFIDGLKKCRMSRPLIAMVTETSINWTLIELLENLQMERMALKDGKVTTH